MRCLIIVFSFRRIGIPSALISRLCFLSVLRRKKGAMLKVTIKQVDSAETWELEGKLSGDWVKELERCWRERPSPTGVSLQVHLKAVSYIDTAGKQLPTEMHRSGVAISGCGCLNNEVVE